MSIQVGFVSSIKGTDITVQMHDSSNKVLYRHDGELYHGVAIRECLSIKNGIYNIVCSVEGEYLDDNKYYENEQEKKIYVRNVLVKPIGYIDHGEFFEGNKYLPMIKDNAYLMTDAELSDIYNSNARSGYIIGKTLKDDVPYKADFNVLFNKHIGIFGNTGSGKSNTLTKLYTDLFLHFKDGIKGKSLFVLFDFNGEYTGKQILDCESNKRVIKLNTKTKEDVVSISEDCFWNEEVLGLLFKSTYNTQRPFLKRLVQNHKKYQENTNSLLDYYTYSIDLFLKSPNQKREIKELFFAVIDLISSEENQSGSTARAFLEKLLWHNTSQCFYYEVNGVRKYFNDNTNIEEAAEALKNVSGFSDLNFMNELLIRAYLQLINDLLKGFVQFDHINPLINRISALKQNLLNVMTLSNSDPECETDIILEVISFRKCNQDIKKILPLIIAKSYYDQHKEYSHDTEITRTMHFIIDEAHNILSFESSREEESWKDYRLDLFEEIIKEGRKFGVFLTISSQRPADISHTIMSQFHNFFIHRLVNDRDLALIDNAISSLDKISKSNIPTLPTGACIITGTSFVIPLTVQVDRIEDKDFRPDSDDVNLSKLWGLDFD